MKKIQIENTFEGYLWWSNQNTPIVYKGGKVFKDKTECDDEKREFELTDGQNPFIVEGKLYDTIKRISYSIKYIDGKYLFNEYQVSPGDLNSETIDQKEYLSNRMGDRLLKVLRYWKEEPDVRCDNMKVLRMEKNVFVGFKEKEN